MRSAFDIAFYLLSQNRDICVGSITSLKLQKLLYYSQAWSLVLRRKKLFREDLEAWVHGPVVPCIYQRFKHYGFTELPSYPLDDSLESDETKILDEVLRTYGMKSARLLEQLSHSEYPWIRARAGLHLNQNSRRKISLESMMTYYSQFADHNQKYKISPLALRIKKVRSKKNFHGQFISGIGSTLEIMPASSVHSIYTASDFSNSLADVESTYSDWEKVGADIQTVFGMIEKNSQ